MIVPFLVAIFWYHRSRVYAAVASMAAGMAAAAIWRFVLQSPYGLGPALFGFLISGLTFILVLPMTCRLPLHRLFQPGEV